MGKALKVLVFLMSMLVCAAGCNKPEEPSISDNGNELNGHEYVDLGLPSGVLWASCNLGATTSEDFGDYIAWGEMAPKEIYDWKSYRYGRFFHDRYELTKYCTDSVYGLDGFVDDLTLLETADDAATAHWGAGWRMPTIDEWEELFLNTTGSWTVQNGVQGWLFTASNGNTLFLPAAGYLWGTVFNAELGLYWSSSVNQDFPNRAWCLHFNSDSAHLCGSSDRNRGQTVRPVCSAN